MHFYIQMQSGSDFRQQSRIVELVVQRFDATDAGDPCPDPIRELFGRDFSPQYNTPGGHLNIDVDLPRFPIQMQSGSDFRQQSRIVEPLPQTLRRRVGLDFAQGRVDSESILDALDPFHVRGKLLGAFPLLFGSDLSRQPHDSPVRFDLDGPPGEITVHGKRSLD